MKNHINLFTLVFAFAVTTGLPIQTLASGGFCEAAFSLLPSGPDQRASVSVSAQDSSIQRMKEIERSLTFDEASLILSTTLKIGLGQPGEILKRTKTALYTHPPGTGGVSAPYKSSSWRLFTQFAPREMNTTKADRYFELLLLITTTTQPQTEELVSSHNFVVKRMTPRGTYDANTREHFKASRVSLSTERKAFYERFWKWVQEDASGARAQYMKVIIERLLPYYQERLLPEQVLHSFDPAFPMPSKLERLRNRLAPRAQRVTFDEVEKSNSDLIQIESVIKDAIREQKIPQLPANQITVLDNGIGEFNTNLGREMSKLMLEEIPTSPVNLDQVDVVSLSLRSLHGTTLALAAWNEQSKRLENFAEEVLNRNDGASIDRSLSAHADSIQRVLRKVDRLDQDLHQIDFHLSNVIGHVDALSQVAEREGSPVASTLHAAANDAKIILTDLRIANHARVAEIKLSLIREQGRLIGSSVR